MFQVLLFKQKQDVPKVDGFGPMFTQKTQNIAKNQNNDYQITPVPDIVMKWL